MSMCPSVCADRPIIACRRAPSTTYRARSPGAECRNDAASGSHARGHGRMKIACPALAVTVLVLTSPLANARELERALPRLPQNQTPKPEDVQAMLAALPDAAAVKPRRP